MIVSFWISSSLENPLSVENSRSLSRLSGCLPREEIAYCLMFPQRWRTWFPILLLCALGLCQIWSSLSSSMHLLIYKNYNKQFFWVSSNQLAFEMILLFFYDYLSSQTSRINACFSFSQPIAISSILLHCKNNRMIIYREYRLKNSGPVPL